MQHFVSEGRLLPHGRRQSPLVSTELVEGLSQYLFANIPVETIMAFVKMYFPLRNR